MTRNVRRHVIRAASASLLAAALGLTGGVAAAAGASAQPQAVLAAEPTPPPGEGEPEPPPPGESEPEAPPPGESEPEAPPPGEGEPEAPPPGESEPEAPPPGEGEPEAPPPGEDGGAPPAERGAPAPQTPDEIRTRIEAGLASSDLSAEEKATVQKSLETVLGILSDPNASPFEKDLASAVGAGLDQVLKLSMDPATSAEDKARYDRLVVGVSEAMAKFTDPDVPADQRDGTHAVLADLNVTLANLAASNLSPADKAYYSLWADQILGGLLAVQQPTTTPKQHADRQRVQEKLKRNAGALKTYQNPDASQADRDAAKKTLDEQAGATNPPAHQELVAELKRLKAPQACLDVVQNRTQQAGWPDGSLWGLSDTTCADTVGAGAQDSGSDWSALFQCVIDNPFSTCASRVPED
ncbi:hypothetical protein ACFY8C_18710 [Streptomyces flavochromogenes]|uniref:Uncharacterized protein n=1 Tax=Streptomyces flavochromogenes TaxID=68199 RepID=A0ABW6XS83_9ACTN